MSPIYEYKVSLKIWEEIKAAETDPRKRAERMLEQGVLHLCEGQIAFDPILTCEALGEAEKAGALDLQAEAYNRIGTFWGKLYLALTLSIWRNAERLYTELHQEKELNLLRANLALSCYLTGEKYKTIDAKLAQRYRNEAKKIVTPLKEPDGDDATKASFKLTRGTILNDTKLIREARTYYEQQGFWDFAISCLDEEIRIAIDKGTRQQALELMQLIKEYALRLGDHQFAQDVEEKMAHINEIQNGPRIPTKPVEEHNLLDVLDIIAYFEERVVFNPVRMMQEKMSTTMDDKRFILTQEGFLMPKFREQMRLFRGETEYHEECKPSLWRKGMDDKAVCFERLKLAEFLRALKLMPENFFFNSGIMVQDPNGKKYHIRLNIDGLALAQHYGIKTELLDLTADKWVAAFFACTNYDKTNDIYSPIVKKTEAKCIMYCYPVAPNSFDTGRLSIVGAQPFERPTEQAAFTLNMTQSDNLNEICTNKFFFSQEPIISLIVYHFANRANRMFPQELIQEKTHALVLDETNKRFSPEIMEWVRNAYYDKMSEEDFRKLLDGIEVGKPGEFNIQVSDEEQGVNQSHFLRFMHLQSMIEVQWYTTMTIS